MDAQLSELLTGYGDVGGIWFDGWWDKPDAEWRLEKTYSLIHRLQPAALVGGNHHRGRSTARISRCSRRTCRGEGRRVLMSWPKWDAALETCETITAPGATTEAISGSSPPKTSSTTWCAPPGTTPTFS